MTTICGHDRETLRWALGGDVVCPKFGSHHIAARTAVYDPAKLAAIIVSELVRLGTNVGNSPIDNEFNLGVGATQSGLATPEPAIGVFYKPWSDHGTTWVLTLPEARATLLRLLTLSEGTPIAEVLKALKVPPAHAVDHDELLNTIPAREYPEDRRFDPDPDREST